MSEPLDVLFIGGTGRSGSTLLERYLARHISVFGAGELYHIWGKAFRTNQLCSCNKKFRNCPVWMSIYNQLSKESHGDDWIRDNERRQWAVEHWWYPLLGYRGESNLKNRHKRSLMNLLQAIRVATHTRLIIASSTLPTRGWILNELEEVRTHVIHLVRDSRGVAYSWTKKKPRPEVYWKDEYLPRKSLLRSSISWNFKHHFMERLTNEIDRYRRIRYEDFVESPERIRERIYQWLELPTDSINSEKQSHSISGNPMRFTQNKIDFELDEAWKTALNPLQRFLITVLTYPYLKQYGYI